MKVTPEIENLTEVCKEHSSLDLSLYQKYDVKIAVPARVPTVTGAEAMCEVGALATLSISYYDLGAKAAEMAYDILVNGKKPAEMPIEYLTDGLVPKYNADIAEALGVTIPEGMEPVA